MQSQKREKLFIIGFLCFIRSLYQLSILMRISRRIAAKDLQRFFFRILNSVRCPWQDTDRVPFPYFKYFAAERHNSTAFGNVIYFFGRTVHVKQSFFTCSLTLTVRTIFIDIFPIFARKSYLTVETNLSEF